MLHISHLTKDFTSTRAVDDVSFDIKAGEIVSVIGPNGSGKTTIIKTITGLLRPSSGSVEVGGISVADEPAKAKELIGYIPDEPSVWPKLTGEEFLHFSASLYGVSHARRKERIPELLEVFRLGDIKDAYFESYSRGNKQKFTILAALLHEPKLLLIDEPIVGLDPTSAERAKRLFAQFAEDGGAVLLATHTLPVAQELSDCIGVLSRGELLAFDTFESLRDSSGLADDASLEDIYNAFVEQ